MRLALVLAVPILTVAVWEQATKSTAPPPTIASAVDREIGTVEKEIGSGRGHAGR
jgi:hypothetical protein